MTATFESMSAEVLRAVWSADDALAYDDLCTQVAPGWKPVDVASALTNFKRRALVVFVDGDAGVLVGPALDAEDAARRAYGELSGRVTCRVCGCSDGWACSEGCAWAEPGLCTSCVEEA